MMAVVKGVTSRQVGEGGESTAPSGTRIMSSGFQYSHTKRRKAAIRMCSCFGLLTKCIRLSSEGSNSDGENTFSLH